MELGTEKSPIVEKTEELCRAILEQNAFAELKQKINTFMEDEEAQKQYKKVLEKQNLLQQKQEHGESLTQPDIDDFEKDKQQLFDNSIAKDFLDAQQEIHKVQETVNGYVTKTFELGRMPKEEDFSEGSCGPGCGCH